MEQTLGQIASQTNNDAILLVIVIGIFVVIGIPLYLKLEKSRKDSESKRESILINVVKENSTAIVKLTTLLEHSDQNCDKCKADQMDHFRDITYKLDDSVQYAIRQEDVLTHLRESSSRLMEITAKLLLIVEKRSNLRREDA